MSTPHHTIHHTTKSTYKKPPSLFLSPLFNTNTRYTTPPTRFSFFSFFLFLSLKRRRSENMGDDEWVKEAMTDDTVVVDLLLRLFQAQPPPPKPVQAVLRLGWTVRQRRSKSAPRHGDSTTKKKAEPARASPTTPLSWSGGTSASGGALDGFEESSRLSKPTESSRSKVCCSDFSHFCSDSVSSCERGYDLGLTTTSDSVWISFCLTLFFYNLRKCPCGSRIFTFIGFRKSQG